jgi:hypothetical protein
MKKTKFTLPVQKWGTIKSKYQPESNYVSPDEFTVGSSNFITNVSGAIEKRPTDVQYNPVALTNPGKDQFEAIFNNGVHQLLFMDGGTMKYTTDGTLHTISAGFTAIASMEYIMYQNRVYFDNGVDAPGVYDLTTSYGGVSYSLPQVKAMGSQVPVSAVTFAADTSGGSVPVGGHFYKVTFLYYGFEESNGGPSSVLHTVSSPNQTVNLTAVPIGGYGVTARKIYRDNNDGNFLLVGTISNNTATTFSDTVSAGTIPIPQSNNLPPTFAYIVLNLSRLWVAGVSGTPTTLYWSNPGLPDLFDPNNFVICNPKDPIQALAVYQGTVYVLNRHSFGQILGNTDDTFYYQEFPGSVGCTDNRSIQVRTINGVPVLIWLSDRGLYAFNGSSVEYISDAIEDEINLNIQQVNFVTGNNSQSTQADFLGGTYSPSIDLSINPGEITTINPIQTFQSESDWESGNLTNIATHDGSNSIKVPTLFAPTLASGTLSGSAQITGGVVTLPSHTPQAPISFSSTTQGAVSANVPQRAFGFAYPFTTDRAGNISATITFYFDNTRPFGGLYQFILYNDNGLGTLPGGARATFFPFPAPSVGTGFITFSPQGFSGLAANTKYWIGVQTVPDVRYNQYCAGAYQPGMAVWRDDLGWSHSVSTFTYGGTASYSITFNPTAVPVSGTWISPIYDTYSTSISTILNIALTGTYSSSSGVVTIEGSNSATFNTIDASQSVSNLNGNQNLSISGPRYWRITYTLATSNDAHVPTMGSSVLTFATTGTWISPTIDCTTDVTSYNALIVTENIPLGTSATITVATSTDDLTYSSYGPVGSATVLRYVKVKVVLVATTDDSSTPSVSLLTFSWNLQGTFTSSAIDLGQVPSGWGLFQDVSAQNGGTLTFYMRSAASSGALSAATYYVVSNGNFPDPNIVPLQFTQWKIIFVSQPNAVPTVDSVTVNWFLGNNQSPIRVASLFFNKTYYLSAAENGQTVNNVVIVWDFEGNWRLFRGLNINSLSLFFNQPFYMDGIRKYIYSWLIPATGVGPGIAMDVRTKAFDAQDHEHLKNPRSLRVMGINTGTTIHAYYSIDRGTTWIEMLNVNGVVGYTTTSDGSKFYEYFVPDYSLGNDLSGVTIMFRVTSMDAFPCEILSIDPEIVVRSGKYLGVAL